MLLGFCLFGPGVIHRSDRFHRLCTKSENHKWRFVDRLHLSSSVGARPSSATLVEQKSLDQRNAGSSVGARPSSAAPVQQNHLDFYDPNR